MKICGPDYDQSYMKCWLVGCERDDYEKMKRHLSKNVNNVDVY